MTNGELVKRIEALEREVAILKRSTEETRKGDLRSWIATAGMFKDDPDFEDAMRIGREYRESLRPGAKKRKTKSSVRRVSRKVAS